MSNDDKYGDKYDDQGGKTPDEDHSGHRVGADSPAHDRRLDMAEWEAQINALLDGELDDDHADALKHAAESEPALARAIIEAYQLQRLMSALPVERAPDSLREKLRRIPAEQESLARLASGEDTRQATALAGGAAAQGVRRWFAFEPRWVMALAAVPLVIAISFQFAGGPKPPSEAELAQARQDMALAFSYLQKASAFTGREIEDSIGTGFVDPVTESTVRTLTDQFDLNEEQDT